MSVTGRAAVGQIFQCFKKKSFFVVPEVSMNNNPSTNICKGLIKSHKINKMDNMRSTS